MALSEVRRSRRTRTTITMNESLWRVQPRSQTTRDSPKYAPIGCLEPKEFGLDLHACEPLSRAHTVTALCPQIRNPPGLASRATVTTASTTAHTWAVSIQMARETLRIRITSRGIKRCAAMISRTCSRSTDCGPLPFKGNALVRGWQISGILTATSALSQNIQDGYDEAAGGTPVALTPRPDYVPAARCRSDR